MKDKENINCPINSFFDERIAMSYWFPKINGLDIPIPETHKLKLNKIDGEPPQYDTEKAVQIVSELDGEAFVRTGYKSAQWIEKGSHIYTSDKEQVEKTILELLSSHAIMQMPTGDYLWIREFLNVDFCHYEDEYLNPELRVFIRDGEVVCYHPRLEGFDKVTDGKKYREKAESYVEWGWENRVKEYAEIVSNNINGWWSVDFVMTQKRNWYLTDMCIDSLYDGEKRGKEGWQNISSHKSGCEHNLQEKYNKNYKKDT